MGFATSVSVAIIFIAIIIISTISYPILIKSFENIQDAKDDRHDIQMEQLNTAIEITILTKINQNTLQITVSNEGKTTLNASRSGILVDGTYTDYTVSPSGFWFPQNDAVFTVSTDTNNNHELKVITERGMYDTGIFLS
ncbi:MAG: hypothetical protein MIO93_10315 [ANME-2 cluster archaeon]|jgi:archaellum component FlaF (FlaF/FlaG flagellin family)|nr:hypothetical protein [ANME-2 cluster archaeon]